MSSVPSLGFPAKLAEPLVTEWLDPFFNDAQSGLTHFSTMHLVLLSQDRRQSQKGPLLHPPCQPRTVHSGPSRLQ